LKARTSLGAALAALVFATPAGGATTTVSIVDHAFMPPRVAVLAGDTVGWRNGSFLNQHTVTGSGFDSGPIVPGGGFFHDFTLPGAYPYACTIHPFMTGEVDAHKLLLNPLGRAVARGATTTLRGRAATGVSGATIEADTGSGFHPVSSAHVEGGEFHATVRPQATGSYRAVSGTDASPPVQVEVSDRRDLAVSVSGRRLRVRVDPLDPGAKVALQLRLRERFGWWTVARARLDRRSHASFRIRHRGKVRARVVLTQSDGWTPLATSAVVRVRREA
jgi:plastocyanin